VISSFTCITHAFYWLNRVLILKFSTLQQCWKNKQFKAKSVFWTHDKSLIFKANGIDRRDKQVRKCVTVGSWEWFWENTFVIRTNNKFIRKYIVWLNLRKIVFLVKTSEETFHFFFFSDQITKYQYSCRMLRAVRQDRSEIIVTNQRYCLWQEKRRQSKFELICEQYDY